MQKLFLVLMFLRKKFLVSDTKNLQNHPIIVFLNRFDVFPLNDFDHTTTWDLKHITAAYLAVSTGGIEQADKAFI
ncbi:MAG TPA: hypothetical protein VJS91_10335 [Nitrososphaeraceae archaeon]|nr:hypothetical protein [Nitrososphaeraceae archaeon]